MKLLICGAREWTDYKFLRMIVQTIPDIELIIEGDCRGADKIAGDVAHELRIPCQAIPAQWKLYPKSAGAIRNRTMLDLKPDLVVAFHDNIAQSKGTLDCLKEAQRRGIPAWLVSHEGVDYECKLPSTR